MRPSCLLLCLCLAACGGGGDNSGTAPATPTPTPTPVVPIITPTPVPVLDETAASLLSLHNQVRRIENAGLPDLVWSAALAGFAQQWADHLAANACTLTHRNGSERLLDGAVTGENLFAGWVSAPYSGYRWSAADVVTAWAGEKVDYDFASKQCAPGKACGHYTQIVWKTTTAVGCGRARCASGEVWVCNYLPAGNIVGQNPY